ncbi:hypothetical protein MmTuc01_1338 [Methanosarcina mazei Tuc01]|uniref:Uncharacterized protein n=1 Tax=Methanosarcina mazei Tuc01 TaxID=1236903 RepID=M1Q938_METMZ|nr:hypothetical protein MmTuc01_1338 [Methanosarcina mazei Tuc01]
MLLHLYFLLQSTVSCLSSYVYQDVKVCPAFFSEKVPVFLAFILLFLLLSEKL